MAKIKTNKQEEPKQLPTVTVTSKSDPRLKSYQDSLRLYNATKDTFNPKYYNKNSEANWYNFKGTRSDVVKFQKNHKIDMDYQYYRTGKFPGKIQPISVKDWGEGLAAPIYKKPVQPVEYKEEPQKDTTQRLQENPKAEIKHADVKIEAPKVEKTKYSINYRDDNSETGQSAIYFKTKQEYKDALNKAMKGKGFAGSSEDKQSASALFYNKPNINGKD